MFEERGVDEGAHLVRVVMIPILAFADMVKGKASQVMAWSNLILGKTRGSSGHSHLLFEGP